MQTVSTPSTAELRGFWESSVQLLAVADFDGTLVSLTQRWADLLQYDLDELVGSNFGDLVHPDDLEATATAAAALQLGSSIVSFENRYVRRDGSVVWLLWDSWGDVANRRIYASATDITATKRAEAELERSNRDLAQFAYVASHDLQEPLRKIGAYCDLLEEDYGPTLDEDGRLYLTRAANGARRMQQLVDDLLALSRAGRSVDRTDVDLDDVLGRVVTALQLRVEETDADLRIGPLGVVRADETSVRQLFQNLLSNALKFRGEERPRIEVAATPGHDHVTVTVSDNGIGMEPRHIERIFAPFQRLHARGEYEGTGIGLAICRRVVERLDGEIMVTSQPGVGTTFHVRLPAGRGAAASRWSV